MTTSPLLFVFDTETTGIPLYREKHGNDDQPHLVQLAAILAEPDGFIVDRFSALVSPLGWYKEMPEAAEAAHHITFARAKAEGQNMNVVLRRFNAMAAKASIIIAHNLPFDRKIIQIAWTRAKAWPEEDRNPFTSGRTLVDTMRLAQPIVNCPPTEAMRAAGREGPKLPSLSECIQHFYGEDLAGAHDALVDAEACLRVYLAIRRAGA